jgi:hypothetical protein
MGRRAAEVGPASGGSEDPADRADPDPVAQAKKFALDPFVAPPAIFGSKA